MLKIGASLKMSSCTICFTSGHNRRNCPILLRNNNQYVRDSLPSYANDLTIDENNIMQPIRNETNQLTNYLNQLEMQLAMQEELNRMHQLYYNNLNNEDYIPFEPPKCKMKISDLKQEIKENFDCPICYETIDIKSNNSYCQFSCEHKFCNNCIKLQTEKNSKICCALCRKKVRTIYTNNKETFV